MKNLIAFLLACVSTAIAGEFIEIDWSNVKPIEEYAAFWAGKHPSLRPPADYFTRQRSRRIVNGEIAEPHQFPYQAGLLFHLPSIGGTALCGGALISTRSILTAAHCVDGTTGGTVVLGAHFINQIEANQQRIAVTPSGVFNHPEWDETLIRNDISVLHLPTAANIVPGVVSLITLPPHDSVTIFDDFPATVSGWGRFDDNLAQSSDVLRFYRGTILSQVNCRLRFPGVILDSNICLSGLNNGGACQGDSGGPLTTTYLGNHTHVGVVSFGLALGCELLWPSVFARTSFYRLWIDETMI